MMATPIRVLLIEDSEDDCLLIRRELKRGGFDPLIERVDSGQALQAALDHREWDVILSDYSLPCFDGFSALEIYHSRGMDIPFIVVSGTIGEDTAVAMMRAGAHDYLMKDNLARLSAAVERELREAEVRRQRRLAAQELRNSEERFRNLIQNSSDMIFLVDEAGAINYASSSVYPILGYSSAEMLGTQWLDYIHPEDVERVSLKLQQAVDFPGLVISAEFRMRSANQQWVPVDIVASNKLNIPSVGGFVINGRDATERWQAQERILAANHELSLAYDATLEGWSRALELREKETAGHSQRVVELTERLAKAIGMNPEALVQVRRGALLHDIGKMGLPDSILLKPGPLSEDEWVVMRQHPVYAWQLLSRIPYLASALEIPYCHHERWDGSGYPQGLKGEQIPLAARIFAVVDVWDALTTSRPYRPAWTRLAAAEYIRQQAGSQFDPQIVAIFFQEVISKESDLVVALP